MPQVKRWMAVSVFSVCFAVLGHQAFAVSVTFAGKTSFLAETGATTDMPIPLPNEGRVAGFGTSSTSYSIGSYTFSLGPGATALFVGAQGEPQVVDGDWTLLHDGPDIALSGTENLDVLVDLSGVGTAYAFGFDIVETTSLNIGGDGQGGTASFIESTFEVRLYDGASMVDSFQFAPENDVLAFAGIWTDSAFDSVEIEEIEGGIGNEFFGHFYVGSTPVPEPASPTVALLVLSFLFTPSARRIRRS